jgi:ADP-ribose pyrophosphatase
VDDTLWELPAGTLEPGESPLETASREVIEETGYRSTRLAPLLEFYTTPGFCNEKMYAFVANDLEFVGQQLDETEKITAEPLSWEKIMEMIRQGVIKDGKTIAVLLYYHFASKT